MKIEYPLLTPVSLALMLIVLTGCRTERHVMLSYPFSRIHVDQTAIHGEPFSIQAGAPLLTVSTNAFVTGRISAASKGLYIEKFDDTLGAIWSTAIKLNDPSIRGSLGLSSSDTTAEDVLRMIVSSGRLVLLTSVKGNNDSVAVIGRLLDLKDGRELGATELMIDAGKNGRNPDAPAYSAAVSPDSSTLLVYRSLRFDRNERQAVKVAVVGADLTGLAATTIEVRMPDPYDRLGQLLVDNRRNVYAMTANINRTPGMIKYRMPSGEEVVRAVAVVGDRDRADGPPRHLDARFANDSTIVILGDYCSGDELRGLSFMALNAATGATSASSYLAVTHDLLDKAAGISSFDDSFLHSIIYTRDTAARYIMLFEERMTRTTGGEYDPKFRTTSKKYTAQTTGNIFVAAFNSRGTPSWQHLIVKDGGWTTDDFNYHSFDAHATSRGTLQLACRNQTNMFVIELNLSNGQEAPGTTLYSPEVNGATAVNFRRYTTWLGDDNMIMTARQHTVDGPWWLLSLKPPK